MSEATTTATPGTPATPEAAAPNTPGVEQKAPGTKEAAAQPLSLEDPKPADPTPDADVVVQYEPTGDPGLDVALAFVGQRGFGPDNPAIQAAQKGDFAPLETELKKLGDKAKGYGPYLAAAKDSYERTQAREKEVQAEVLKVFGGAAQWNDVRAWVIANADESEKKQINAAFAGGKLQAMAMARQLAQAYRDSGESTKAPPTGRKSAGTPDVEAGTGALSPEEYRKELSALTRRYGGRIDNRPEFKALRARRQAYQGA